MILVTGGMGFIGLHVVKRLLDAGASVVVTWNHSWRVPEFWGDELGKRVIAERVDVTYPHDVLSAAKKHNVDSIIHLATPVVGTASPSQDYMINMHGLLNVLEAARLVGARRLTFAGSSTLYSGLTGGPTVRMRCSPSIPEHRPRLLRRLARRCSSITRIAST